MVPSTLHPRSPIKLFTKSIIKNEFEKVVRIELTKAVAVTMMIDKVTEVS